MTLFRLARRNARQIEKASLFYGRRFWRRLRAGTSAAARYQAECGRGRGSPICPSSGRRGSPGCTSCDAFRTPGVSPAGLKSVKESGSPVLRRAPLLPVRTDRLVLVAHYAPIDAICDQIKSSAESSRRAQLVCTHTGRQIRCRAAEPPAGHRRASPPRASSRLAGWKGRSRGIPAS